MNKIYRKFKVVLSGSKQTKNGAGMVLEMYPLSSSSSSHHHYLGWLHWLQR